MNSVYVPANVALILRRVVNIVSGLSVSSQYFLHRRRPRDSLDGPSNEATDSRVSNSSSSATPTAELNMTSLLDEPTNKTDSASGIPTTLKWWPAFLSSSTRDATQSHESKAPIMFQPDKNNRPNPAPRREPKSNEHPKDIIHTLMHNPTLYEPLRKPRYPIALCHGLYGFDVIGPESFPSFRVHYWSTILSVLRDTLGVEVIVTSCPGTGSIVSRSETIHEQLKRKAHGRGVNFLAHSMGGLDCRHLISHIRPREYTPLSLTSIATPHRGSPFMDWCANNIGIGKMEAREELLSRSRSDPEDIEDWYHYPPTNNNSNSSNTASASASSSSSSTAKKPTFSLANLPSSFTTLLLSVVDSPAYNNLTTSYLQNTFNPNTPDDPRVKYFSVASRMSSVNVWHPFWLPKMVLDGVEERERGALKQRSDASQPYDKHMNSNLRGEDIPLWARENEWGNDGLVPIQSAKWGEFLGIIEGADHWEIRGARGIMAGVDALPLVGSSSSSTTNSNNDGDGWGFKDWGRFVSAWKKEENRVKDAASTGKETQPQSPTKAEQEKEETLLRSTANTLSPVFDWLTDHVPGSGVVRPSSPSAAASLGQSKSDEERSEGRDYPEMKKHMDSVENTPRRKKKELESLQDLERFYIALTRKLYDEGL